MKQYLKMADVFRDVVQPERFNYAMANPKATYAAHAINSHDELVAENERLRDEIAVALGEKQSTVIIPEGWQLVPVEPTLEMISAATRDSVGFGTRAAYKAMLAAAPKPEGGAA